MRPLANAVKYEVMKGEYGEFLLGRSHREAEHVEVGDEYKNGSHGKTRRRK